MAICVVGEPRAFDLTGPSIRRHVLAAYNNSDVFFNLAFTDNTHKLTAISGLPNQVALRVFPQVPVNETDASRSVLTDNASPGGFQVTCYSFLSGPSLHPPPQSLANHQIQHKHTAISFSISPSLDF